MYLTINMAPAYQLQMNFPEAIPPEQFTRQLTNSEPSFPITLKDFTDPTSNLESLAAKPKLLKEMMQQIKHSCHTFLQRERGLKTFRGC